MHALMNTKKTELQVRFDSQLYSVKVTFDRGGRNSLHRSKTPRVFLFGEPDPEDVSTSDFTEHPPYGSTRGDGSDDDKAWKRYNREAVAIMRTFSTVALDALGLAGLYEGTTYNRHAGCSCSCSPGMNIRGFDAERASLVLGTSEWSTGDQVSVDIEKVESV